jgi:hypothetical protein
VAVLTREVRELETIGEGLRATAKTKQLEVANIR